MNKIEVLKLDGYYIQDGYANAIIHSNLKNSVYFHNGVDLLKPHTFWYFRVIGFSYFGIWITRKIE